MALFPGRRRCAQVVQNNRGQAEFSKAAPDFCYPLKIAIGITKTLDPVRNVLGFHSPIQRLAIRLCPVSDERETFVEDSHPLRQSRCLVRATFRSRAAAGHAKAAVSAISRSATAEIGRENRGRVQYTADSGHLVIHRNLLEYPRGGANDWESGHPSGPQAITLIDSRGGNVIRYNTIRSTDDHGFNDGIGGGSNYSFKGSPNRDSDIHGNIISNCWDDAIESEGANMNVRIWSNYIHHTFVHVAPAATSMGPLYIFRNVFGESRISHQDPSGGMMIKTGMNYLNIGGERVSTGLGYQFIYHNTALQPNGGLDVFSSHELHNAVSRNNIFYSRGRADPQDRGEPHNDFQNDLTGGYLGGGTVRSMFLPSEGLEWYPAPTMNRIQWGRIEYTRNGRNFAITDPLVQAKNPALDGAVRLPGFNDEYRGAAPDIGAFETGLAPLRFGREMAPGFTRPPWEMY
jgi:hypothetical protein